MKTHSERRMIFKSIIRPTSLLIVLLFGIVARSAPLETAFTYQGQLLVASNAANGHHDLLFNLCTALNAGNTNASTTNLNVAVVNGIFTTPVDFGSNVFDGTDYWIEIAVRTNGSVGCLL